MNPFVGMTSPKKMDTSSVCSIFWGQFPRKWGNFVVTTLRWRSMSLERRVWETQAQSAGLWWSSGPKSIKIIPLCCHDNSLSNFRDQRDSDAGWAFAKRQSLSRESWGLILVFVNPEIGLKVVCVYFGQLKGLPITRRRMGRDRRRACYSCVLIKKM